uniref:PDZ domain-containing protein n=1 Tax=Glossina austeni TaxID=7395 RepID=A0A1A9V3C9_GLOAU
MTIVVTPSRCPKNVLADLCARRQFSVRLVLRASLEENFDTSLKACENLILASNSGRGLFPFVNVYKLISRIRNYRSLRFAHSRLSSPRLTLFLQPINSSFTALPNHSKIPNFNVHEPNTPNKTATTTITLDINKNDAICKSDDDGEERSAEKTATQTTACLIDLNAKSSSLTTLRQQLQPNYASKTASTFNKLTKTPEHQQKSLYVPASNGGKNYVTFPLNSSCASSSSPLVTGIPNKTMLQHHRPSLPIPKISLRDEEMAEVIRASMSDGIFVKTVFLSGQATDDGSLQAGDEIVEINEQSVQGMSLWYEANE